MAVQRLLPLLLLLLPTLVHAQEIPRRPGTAVDSWSEPHPGVRYLHRTVADPALSVHALVVDLSVEGVELVTTSEAERWDSISGFAHRRGAVAAINGGFWGMLQRPEGLAMGDGEVWRHAEPSEGFGHVAVTRDGRARVYAPGEGEDARSLRRTVGAVSGRPVLVTRGAAETEALDAFATSNLKQPRTALGVSRDGRTAILVVADGRQGHSRGMTLYQLARLMIELGAYRAINLDGGGSSAMYVERVGGLVSSPARGRWARILGDPHESGRTRTRRGERQVYVRGVEREVMNHIAVIAPSRDVAVAATDEVLLDGLGHLAAQNRRPRVDPVQPLKLGVLREWLYPTLLGGVPVALMVMLLAAIRRMLRRVQLELRSPARSFGESS